MARVRPRLQKNGITAGEDALARKLWKVVTKHSDFTEAFNATGMVLAELSLLYGFSHQSQDAALEALNGITMAARQSLMSCHQGGGRSIIRHV